MPLRTLGQSFEPRSRNWNYRMCIGYPGDLPAYNNPKELLEDIGTNPQKKPSENMVINYNPLFIIKDVYPVTG